MGNARIQITQGAKRGGLVTVRVLVLHPMETGFRYEMSGAAVPKNVIREFVCRYNGTEIFRAEADSGIAANPYFEFFAVATANGMIEAEWVDDAGVRGTVAAAISVIQ